MRIQQAGSESPPTKSMPGETPVIAADSDSSSKQRAAVSPSPRPRAKRLSQWLTAGAVLASAVASWLLGLTSPLASLELKTYDLRYLLSGKQAAPSGIMLVLIDDRTDQAITEPHIFWHPYYASVLRAASAAGARSIGLDVSFTLSVEQWEPGLDRQIAAAFAEASASTPVVLAYDRLQPLPQDQPRPQDLPLYMMASAQGAVGFANLTLDRDGFVRRQELLTPDEAALESFPARLAAVSTNGSWTQAAWNPTGIPPDPARRTLRLGGRTVPLDASGAMLIHYWGPAGTFPSVSMVDVLKAAEAHDTAALEKWFKGQIVLIGTRDSSDRQSTPFYLAGGGEQQSPGVEIQASTLATLLDQLYLRETSKPLQMALVLVAALLAALCITQMKFPAGPLALVGALLCCLVASVVLLREGIVLPVTSPVLAVVLAGLTSYGAQALTEGRQKRLLQEVFGRYVSAEVAQELLDYGEVPLGGSRQDVTVMFTDLRNYTNYCQGRDPHQVVEELNEYFADMSAEIKAHGGMINKFIGDGIMALFGAPVPHADDARRAVACALKMVERNDAYNRRRRERGMAPLLIGIGLHTGNAVVGNIGAPEKMEYTAIGDTVNVASRIEGENKTFGTQLLISVATYAIVREAVIAESVGLATMKGVDEPMTLYRVVALR